MTVESLAVKVIGGVVLLGAALAVAIAASDWEPMRILLLASLYDRGHVDVADRLKERISVTLEQNATRLLLSPVLEAVAKRSADFLSDLVALILSRLPHSSDRLLALAGLERLLEGSEDARAAARTAILRNESAFDTSEPWFEALLERARSP